MFKNRRLHMIKAMAHILRFFAKDTIIIQWLCLSIHLLHICSAWKTRWLSNPHFLKHVLSQLQGNYTRLPLIGCSFIVFFAGSSQIDFQMLNCPGISLWPSSCFHELGDFTWFLGCIYILINYNILFLVLISTQLSWVYPDLNIYLPT